MKQTFDEYQLRATDNVFKLFFPELNKYVLTAIDFNRHNLRIFTSTGPFNQFHFDIKKRSNPKCVCGLPQTSVHLLLGCFRLRSEVLAVARKMKITLPPRDGPFSSFLQTRNCHRLVTRVSRLILTAAYKLDCEDILRNQTEYSGLSDEHCYSLVHRNIRKRCLLNEDAATVVSSNGDSADFSDPEKYSDDEHISSYDDENDMESVCG